MAYAPFDEQCPDVAERETRNIVLTPATTTESLLPAGAYQFVEMYCDEPGCDCRRVMFSVLSSVTGKVEAVVAWGWETVEYYRRWMGGDDPMIEEMRGPVLNLASAQGPHANDILELTKDVLLKDPAYIERLKKHYAMFRQQIERGGRPRFQRESFPETAASPKARAGERRRRRKSSGHAGREF
jgi:hypothetical protein